MVFAAMVGYSQKRFVPVEAKKRGPEIYEEIFARNKTDGLVFLLALDAEKDGDVLRDSREGDCWKHIEGYAEGGFQIIQQWLLDRPGDPDGVETILSRMSERAAEKMSNESESLTPDVEF
jgi:dnd system-associated protein 4